MNHLSILRIFILWAASLMVSFTGLSLSAQETLDPGTFSGFWELPEPAGDTCVVIIKKGGQISSFWSGSGTTPILKGSWKLEEDRLIATWETGHYDVFTKLGENAIQRESFEPGSAASASPTSTVRGTRVDSRLPGSLTVQKSAPATAEEEENVDKIAEETEPFEAPALPLRNAFTGFWQVRQGGSFLSSNPNTFYLHLQRNGSAFAALRNQSGAAGETGKWQVDGESILINWPSGARDRLVDLKNGSYELQIYGARGKDRPDSVQSAEKVSAADAQRYFQAGEFQMLTVLDIRGTWASKAKEEDSEYLEIEGWGNAYRASATRDGRSDPGKWRLLNNRVQVTWVDGSRDVIRPTTNGFVRESYAPGEPVTGQPMRVQEVIRIAERGRTVP